MGAYDFGLYRKGLDGRPAAWTQDPEKGERLAAAILAIKLELVYNGTPRALKADVPVIGDAAYNAIVDFQKAHGLPGDGQAGTDTLRELFRKRIETVEALHKFPPGILGKKLGRESAFDPVAIGQDDPRDRGMSQINLKVLGGYHDVTVEQAYDPPFAVEWAAAYIDSQKREVERRADTLRAARAAYNVGAHYATLWMKAGFPEGDPNAARDSQPWWFARAHNYLRHIDLANF